MQCTSFRLFTCSPSTSSEPFLPQTTLRWAWEKYKSCVRLEHLKLALCRALNLTQKRMNQPWRLLGRTCSLSTSSSSGTPFIIFPSVIECFVQVSWVFRFPTESCQEIYRPAFCHGGISIETFTSSTMMLSSPAFGPFRLRRPARERFPQNNSSQNLWQVLSVNESLNKKPKELVN